MSENKELQDLLAESRQLQKEAEAYLFLQGKQYKFSEWVTIKEYARRFSLESTMVVSNWISRGVIPPENVITISALNNIRLVKAIPYRES